jgi:hypothetical protein
VVPGCLRSICDDSLSLDLRGDLNGLPGNQPIGLRARRAEAAAASAGSSSGAVWAYSVPTRSLSARGPGPGRTDIQIGASSGTDGFATGDVSSLAMIPVAVGLLAVCGNRRGLGAITSLAIVAMVVMTTVSMLMVLGLASFAAATDSAYIGMIFLFGWVFAAGRAGRASGRICLL